MIRNLWSEGWLARGVVVLIALIIVAMPFGIYAAFQQHHHWIDWCHTQGGHVIDHTTYSTGIGSDGKSTTTTSNTTYYCLNKQGGIIDIEG